MRFFAALFTVLTAFAQPPVGSRAFRLDELQTPPGFEASVYANVPAPRLMTFGTNGVLYIASSATGSVFAVSGPGNVVVALRGLPEPHSVTFQGTSLFIGAGDGVYRADNAIPSDLVIRSRPMRIITLPVGGQHSTRTASSGPDGKLYVTAGSTCNFCIESDPRRATAMRSNIDGSNQEIFARGLRNSVGLAWHPVTGELWATDNGGDGLGNDIPPDEINILREGGDYGWPDCYANQQPVDWGPGARVDRCGSTLAPQVALQAHSAPLGISFYTGAQFPPGYFNDAFVAFHGSWNRDTPTGYKVVRVHTGRRIEVEDFLWGFLDLNSRTTSGRPVDPVMGPDGALYVSDDLTGNIYRVVYTGRPARRRWGG